jgi:hypothetical protein
MRIYVLLILPFISLNFFRRVLQVLALQGRPETDAEILEDIVAGKGREEDMDKLQEIAGLMRTASLCALGRTQ